MGEGFGDYLAASFFADHNRPGCNRVLASIRDVFVAVRHPPQPEAQKQAGWCIATISITASLRAKRRAHPLLEEESDARYII